MESYVGRRESSATGNTGSTASTPYTKELSSSDIVKMFEEIKSTINVKNKEDDTRQDRNEKLVEAMTSNFNKLTDTVNRLIPRIGDIENRLSSVEEKIDSQDMADRIDKIEDAEQALARISDLEDRLAEAENKIEENCKLKQEVDMLIEARIWEEYERKRENLIIYGLLGKEGVGKSVEVARKFLVDDLKMTKEWVEKLQIKYAMRLQSTGDSPAPLKIAFFYPEDKEACLKNGRNLKGTNLSLRTDLPKAMRVDRAILATKAYNMKKNGEVKHTRIRLKGISVWLEAKVTDNDDWKTIK